MARYMAYPPRDEKDAGYLGSRAGQVIRQQSIGDLIVYLYWIDLPFGET